VLPVDVNASEDGCESIDGGRAIRLGLRLLRGLSEGERAAILAARAGEAPFASLVDFCARVTPEIRRDRLEELILAGAFDSLHGAERRRGLLLKLDDSLGLARELRAQGVQGEQRALTLTARVAEVATPCADGIAEFSPWRRLAWEWRLTGVCAQVHPFALLRPRLAARGVLSVVEARECKEGEQVTVAGLNLRPHRPPTKSGAVVLYTEVEDETSHPLQVICLGDALDRCTATILLSPAVLAEGIVERRRGIALRLESVRPLRLSV
jgi:error-prone DNA polymerase